MLHDAEARHLQLGLELRERTAVTHELTGAPKTAAQVSGKIREAGGGWSFILSDLKTLLETGKAFGG